jgi:ferrous iron transport protein A
VHVVPTIRPGLTVADRTPARYLLNVVFTIGRSLMAHSLKTPTVTRAAPAPEGTQLSLAAPLQRVRILHIDQEHEHAAWLRAVGMHEDAEVTVLRRAPFGGPIHLRSTDGGEFAIHRDLAHSIMVRAVSDPSAGPGE